jgi:rRNA methylases
VPWEYSKDTKEAISKLKSQISKLQLKTKKLVNIVAVEQYKNSIPYTQANYHFPLALIFGNESYGVKEETLKLCDQIVEIPMYGINKSLNVIVAAGIVSYFVINKLFQT